MSQAFMYSSAKHSFVLDDTSKGNGNIVCLCSYAVIESVKIRNNEYAGE